MDQNNSLEPMVNLDFPPERLTEPPAEMQAMLEWTLDEARKRGVSSAEAGAHFGAGIDVSARLGKIESIEHARDRGLALTVYLGQRCGSASTADFSRAAITRALDAACTIASYTMEDPWSGLADPRFLAHDFPDLDLDHPQDITVERLVEVAQRCEQSAMEVDERIFNSEGASCSYNRGIHLYANTNAFMGLSCGTRYSCGVSVLGRDEHGMQRDAWFDVARKFADLTEAEQMGVIAARRALQKLGGHRIPTQRSPIILEAPIASSLFRALTGAANGNRIYRHSSFLEGQVGQPIFPEWLQIREYPHLKRALGSAVFDAEGVATKEQSLIESGRLSRYVLDSYAARRLGLETTGNAGGVHNLTVESNAGEIDELLLKMDRGLLVTELMGHGTDLTSGDYSHGATGFWVENGQIVHPVEEVTIAGNLRDMFKHIVAIGNDVDLRHNIRSGSVLLEGMTIAGA